MLSNEMHTESGISVGWQINKCEIALNMIFIHKLELQRWSIAILLPEGLLMRERSFTMYILALQ